ncbi:MAG: hypothetical protein FJ087_10605 [Deltaproteobacteria bacterium]|nr:hypothetical protein [Deltaproteobacteria bacterium]
MSGSSFAIYLNANARRVSPDVVTRIEELVHPDDIFYCSAPSDADGHAARILERGYATVFTGGGDGTVVELVNALYRVAGGAAGPGFPKLGVLSLGTGNAISRLVSSGSAVQDLKSYVSNPSSDAWPIALLRCEGRLFPFGSVGLDAQILADYVSMKSRASDGPLKPVLQNVGGYFVAFFGGSVPRMARRALGPGDVRMRVTTLAQAFGLAPSGETLRAYAAGEVLYDGPAKAVMAGTVPFYGYGMRLLPHAGARPGFMHLRAADIGLIRAFANLRGLWRGSYRFEGLHDYHATRVRIECSEPVPFQMAGDLFGERSAVEMEVVPDAVRLVRFI